MTLFRQLALIVILLFIIGFVGTVYISIDNTRNFLVNQLKTHAQDTATSLALSITPHVANDDIPVIHSMFDVIFDGGYYKQIEYVDIDGNRVINREYPIKIENVPDWFVRLIPVFIPQGQAPVTAGWNQAGYVYVSSNPGYAYAELWKNTVDAFWLFLLSAIGALILGLFLIRLVMKPLRAVEAQANAICKREYPVQEHLPWTTDLRTVVRAMNRMTNKVKEMFNEQSTMTEHFREQAFIDNVTGFGNRTYFDNQIEFLLSHEEEFSSCVLIIVALNGFKEFNDRHGYVKGDELLKQSSNLIRTSCERIANWQAARMSGAEFAILIPEIARDEIDHLAQRITNSLVQLPEMGYDIGTDIAHIGIVRTNGKQSKGELLSIADQALGTAQSKGPNSHHLIDADELSDDERKGAAEWKRFLENVIETKNILLEYQPVVSMKSIDEPEVIHYEVLMRIPNPDGTKIVAGVFMPMAERLGLTTTLDQVTIDVIIDKIKSPEHHGQVYAINLSPASIWSSNFRKWLYDCLKQNSNSTQFILFEFPEYGVISHLEEALEFTNQVTELGAKCSIDHFGKGFSSFSYLRSLKLDYLKVDGSNINQIDSDKDQQFFLQALTRTVHGIDIKVIAENVETQEQWNTLQSLMLDGAQGYLIGKPDTKFLS